MCYMYEGGVLRYTSRSGYSVIYEWGEDYLIYEWGFSVIYEWGRVLDDI